MSVTSETLNGGGATFFLEGASLLAESGLMHEPLLTDSLLVGLVLFFWLFELEKCVSITV